MLPATLVPNWLSMNCALRRCHLAFLARLHFVIAGDDPASCEARLA
jgi:hypothetical protein